MGTFFVWLSCVMFTAVLAASNDPPKVKSGAQRQHVIRVGDAARIPCPVEADSTPLLQWYKDGETINAAWDRFRMGGSALRIRDVIREDAGHYVCKATNGFGSVTVQLAIHVLDVNETFTPPPPPTPSGTGGSDAKPQFVAEDLGEHTMSRPSGSTVRLRCRALGRPRPQVTWLKDGQMMTDVTSEDEHRFTLKLVDVEDDDAGEYTCKVYNRAGEIYYTYDLKVTDQTREKPELVAPHPENATVPYGGTASFLCRVRSAMPPHIQWLKRLDNQETVDQLNTTITVDNQQFMVLKTGKVLPRSDGSYLNKLTIQTAIEADSGMYICLGANSMGYSIRSAYLNVLPNPHRSHETPSMFDPLSLPLVVGLAAAILIIILILVAYFVYKRNAAQRQKAVARTIARASPYSPQDKPHQYEHQYAVLQQHVQGMQQQQQQQAPHNLHMQPPVQYHHSQYVPQAVMPPRSDNRMMYPDLHNSEVSLPVSHTPVIPQQHTHVHYGGC